MFFLSQYMLSGRVHLLCTSRYIPCKLASSTTFVLPLPGEIRANR